MILFCNLKINTKNEVINMDIVVMGEKENKHIELGDIVEVYTKNGSIYYYLLMRDSDEYILKNLNGDTYLEKGSLTEIMNYLNTNFYVKSYRIFSHKEYELVLRPKTKC
jgi:hypothetical protein